VRELRDRRDGGRVIATRRHFWRLLATYLFFAMSGFAERDSAHTESLDTHLSTVAHKKDLNVHNTGHVTLLNT